MSKKIAAGANKIVLEVTCGNGAFMKTKEDALKLAEMMIRIGKLADKETICVLTNMDEPIGYSIGNNLEVIEAIEALKGNMEEDVKKVVLELGSYMIYLSGLGDDIEDNKRKMIENIKNGKALQKFKQLVQNQGGDISYIEDTSKFKKARYHINVKAKEEGYVQKIEVEKLGNISCMLGAGRIKKEDEINDKVGLIINKKVGDFVKKQEVIAQIHADDINLGNDAVEMINSCYIISNGKKDKLESILGIVK